MLAECAVTACSQSVITVGSVFCVDVSGMSESFPLLGLRVLGEEQTQSDRILQLVHKLPCRDAVSTVQYNKVQYSTV